MSLEDFKACVYNANTEEEKEKCVEHLEEDNVQIRCGRREESVMPDEIKDVENPESCLINKPEEGGLWSSSFTPFDEYCSDWIDWMSFNEPDWMSKDCVITEPKKGADVYEIEDWDDYYDLMEEYSREGHMGKKCLDFEKLSEDYDGIRITDEGLHVVSALSDDIVGFRNWDAESTVWFNREFEEVEDIEDVSHSCELTGKKKDRLNL